MELWRYVLPLQIVCLILSYLVVIPLARLERKNGAGMTAEEFQALKATLNQPVETKVSIKVIYFDIALTIAILIAMLSGIIKSNLQSFSLISHAWCCYLKLKSPIQIRNLSQIGCFISMCFQRITINGTQKIIKLYTTFRIV